MSDTWALLAMLALAPVCFEVGERLHGSGFVATFAGGRAYSMMVRRSTHRLAGCRLAGDRVFAPLR
jgi:NhaP-type Na+/H+ or K+/H+ antiporter